MDSLTQQRIEILNRLKRGTTEGRVLWERTGEYGDQFAAPLDNEHRALIAATPGAQAVLFTMTNGQGVQTLYLDSSRADTELLQLALLQLFVTVRDKLSHNITSEALEAVKDL